MNSIWEDESFYAPHDFVIAGAGLTGLWCAYELKQKFPGAKISILEKELISTGASTRNAGFACFGSPSEMLHDAGIMGAEKMWDIVAMRYEGIQKIRRVFSDEEINYETCGGFECFSNSTFQVPDLQNKLKWLNDGMLKVTGEADAFTMSSHKIKTFQFSEFDEMVENKLEGSLHAGKLVQVLMQKVQGMGVHIFSGTPVLKWKKTKDEINVLTPKNKIITKHLILATNAFTNSLTNEKMITPARGQIILTSPIKDLPVSGTFHFNEGFYYFRNLQNRLLLGGARNVDIPSEETTVMETTGNIQHELEHFLSTHILPGRNYTIEKRWSGIMAFTADKLPKVKAIDDGVIAVICCNGMGVALSPVMPQRVISLLEL
jgi:gamma-glutamylputrescine oxidase